MLCLTYSVSNLCLEIIGHFKSIGVHVCFCNVVIKYIQI